MSSGTADEGIKEEQTSILTGQSGPQIHGSLRIRAAQPEDAPAISRILVEAFPALYRPTFGDLGTDGLTTLMTRLYGAGHLSLAATQVAEREGRVVGLAVLHVGESIGRGRVWDFGRLLLRHLGLFRAIHAFFGGLSANTVLNRRIPHAPDLAYIEALAVAEGERGKGVGTRLLEDAMEWTRTHQRSRLALHVLVTNTGARRLYERMGFQPWNRTPTRRFFSTLFSRRPSAWSTILMVRPVPPTPNSEQ